MVLVVGGSFLLREASISEVTSSNIGISIKRLHSQRNA